MRKFLPLTHGPLEFAKEPFTTVRTEATLSKKVMSPFAALISSAAARARNVAQMFASENASLSARNSYVSFFVITESCCTNPM